MRENVVPSESTSGENISEEAIREALSRILESAMFIQSDRLSRFLRFTVEATLAGEADLLKEYLIGTEVYDRKPPYHPNADSIVRCEARRLRSKLKEYYESVGKDDPVLYLLSARQLCTCLSTPAQSTRRPYCDRTSIG